MHLGAEEAAEREDERTAQSGHRIESQGLQVQVREQARQEHVQHAHPDHRERRRQQVQQQQVRQIGQAKLAVGEDRIAGEDAGQPEWEHARLKLLADPLRQRVVEELGV